MTAARFLFCKISQCQARPARIAEIEASELWRPSKDPRPLGQLTGAEAAAAVSDNLRRRSKLTEAKVLALWVDVELGTLMALVADPSLDLVRRGEQPMVLHPEMIGL